MTDHRSEEWVLLDLLACLQENVDLPRGLHTLQLLTLEHLLLELIERLVITTNIRMLKCGVIAKPTLFAVTKASATLRLRPPKHEVMRSATPALFWTNAISTLEI